MNAQARLAKLIGRRPLSSARRGLSGGVTNPGLRVSFSERIEVLQRQASAHITQRLNRDQVALGIAPRGELSQGANARLIAVAEPPEGGRRAKDHRLIGVVRQGDERLQNVPQGPLTASEAASISTPTGAPPTSAVRTSTSDACRIFTCP